MSNRYEIRELGDFMAVPKDRRDACLKDFALWVELNHALREELGELYRGAHFVWVDDGLEWLSGVNITFVPVAE